MHGWKYSLSNLAMRLKHVASLRAADLAVQPMRSVKLWRKPAPRRCFSLADLAALENGRTSLRISARGGLLPCPPPRACAGAYRLFYHCTGDKADLCDPIPQAPQPLVVLLVENCETVAGLEAARCGRKLDWCLQRSTGVSRCGWHERAVAVVGVKMDANPPELITRVAVVVNNGGHDGSRLLQALFVSNKCSNVESGEKAESRASARSGRSLLPAHARAGQEAPGSGCRRGNGCSRTQRRRRGWRSCCQQ